MNPEEQRIAIAEACGWKPCYKGCHGKTWRLPDDSTCQSELPDYLNDLNAMHEAENIMPDDMRQTWEGQLHDACGGSWSSALSATAAQRAEAFLKTLNLWTDES